MKNRFIKILPLLLALSVLIGMVSCLASCSFSEFVTDTVDGLLGKDDGNDNEAPNNGSASDDGSSKDDETADNQQKPDDSKDSETNTDNVPNDGATPPDSGTEEDETEEEVEFYPGQGSVPADKIDPKNRTLLSTVDIVANFGYTPSAGSGVIYKLDKEKGDAYIITNYHVVFSGTYGMALEVKLYLYGMRYEQYAITATVVGGSVNYDIAVLKVTGSEVLKNSYAMAADLGNSEDVRVFDDIFVVGNAEGYGMSVTEGIISVDSESLDMQGADGTPIELRVMRVSAAINRGNSGGAVYDESGKLIGIVVAKRTGSDVDNMGYAIPINAAEPIISQLMNKEELVALPEDEQSYLGISGATLSSSQAAMQAVRPPVGVYVAGIIKGGPAELAGLKRGDVITKFEGNSIATMEELQKYLAAYPAGETIVLTYERLENGEYVEYECEVILQKKEP